MLKNMDVTDLKKYVEKSASQAANKYIIFIRVGTLKSKHYSPAEGEKCSNSLDFDLFYLASYHLLKKQREYNQ